MKTFRHGPIRFDYPGEWDDASRLILVDGRRGASGVNLQVSRQRRGPDTLRDQLARHLDQVCRDLAPMSVKVVRSEPYRHDLYAGWLAMFEFEMPRSPSKWAQIHVLFEVGPEIYTFVWTGLGDSLGSQRMRLDRLLASFQVTPDASEAGGAGA